MLGISISKADEVRFGQNVHLHVSAQFTYLTVMPLADGL